MKKTTISQHFKHLCIFEGTVEKSRDACFSLVKAVMIFFITFSLLPDIASGQTCTDGDSDGYAIEGDSCGPVDCNDNDPAVHPGTYWYEDNDGDGYGKWGASIQQCNQLSGYVINQMDCADWDINLYPGGPAVRNKNTSSYHMSIQSAYDASGNGHTIQIKDTVLTENLFFDQNKTVILESGYDCRFLTVKGSTTISGDMIISYGTVIINSGSIHLIEDKTISFGVITDLHYNTTPNYSDRISILNTAVQIWNGRADVSFVIELGDFIQEVDATLDVASQSVAEASLLKFNGNVYGVLGNHELLKRSAVDYVNASSIMPSEYYSFDLNGIHFIILNANNYPLFSFGSTQLAWLENDLASSQLPAIVFTHQRVDQTYPGDDPSNPNNPWCIAGTYPVNCYSAMAYDSENVRTILESDGNVLAVFSGHSHQNDIVEVNGIEYFAMINAYPGNLNAAFAIVHVTNNNYIRVEGFGKQDSY